MLAGHARTMEAAMNTQKRSRSDAPYANLAANPRTPRCLLVLVLTCFTALAGNVCAETSPFIPIDLGTFGGRGGFSLARAVNDSGQVIGVLSTADGFGGAFSWT